MSGYDPMMPADVYWKASRVMRRQGWTGTGNTWRDPSGALHAPFDVGEPVVFYVTRVQLRLAYPAAAAQARELTEAVAAIAERWAGVARGGAA